MSIAWPLQPREPSSPGRVRGFASGLTDDEGEIDAPKLIDVLPLGTLFELARLAQKAREGNADALKQLRAHPYGREFRAQTAVGLEVNKRLLLSRLNDEVKVEGKRPSTTTPWLRRTRDETLRMRKAVRKAGPAGKIENPFLRTAYKTLLEKYPAEERGDTGKE